MEMWKNSISRRKADTYIIAGVWIAVIGAASVSAQQRDTNSVAVLRRRLDSTQVIISRLGQPIAYKDPSAAMVLGFMMAGAGQFYADRRVAGLFELGIATVGVTCASSAPSIDTSRRNICLLGAIAAWSYGLLNAAEDARAANERILRDIRTSVYSP